ncbi:NAD(P)H-dependent oxidoreductase [Hoeflea sp. YIM 152468]|uniref:NADPH-dependent FMN reductase n=1 Tax=Hoeflea sp. YIM 152468 TaxID=3031759 RepID=UPI0023DA4148|nr:NAD(P)H-dependent oxidoreductase [Hoeflea sp. YIM 152468]MDF1610424.1 NAD(P)H-dependent oxidoreductase [Hoeflea sp. YIM 152468]
MIPKILVFPGSNRSGAFSAALAAAAAYELAQQGADVTRISLSDYPLPIVDEDLKAQSGIPDNAMKLGRLIAAHHGVFMCCPEYNASIPPLLKNMIDWVSLISKDDDRPFKPWSGRYVALGSSSNGKFGGIRCLNHVRTVMMNVGTQIISEQCSVSGAAEAFEADGRLKDERTQAMLAKTCNALIAHCMMMSGR